MNVLEYLSNKYGTRLPTTITRVEAKILGIPYPLRKGWRQEFGHSLIRLDQVDAIQCALSVRAAKQERRNKKHGAAVTRAGLKAISRRGINATSDAFLTSFEWRRVRMMALKRYGPVCQCCGASPPEVKIHVDHIKPRRLFPHLALDLDNLQILCDVCNHGKGNWDMTDWRPNDEKLDAEQAGHLHSILRD